MGNHHFRIGPDDSGDFFIRHWRGGVLFIWGRYDSAPAGTKFHLKVVPTQVPQHMIDAGVSPEVIWLVGDRNSGIDGTEFARGFTSPALVVPAEAPISGGSGQVVEDTGPDASWAAGLAVTKNEGIPLPGEEWDWAIGAALRIYTPMDWVSPSPSLDEFRFRAEVWSSKAIPNPSDPEHPGAEADQFLYALEDGGIATLDHPLESGDASCIGPLYVCPGMAPVATPQLRIPEVTSASAPNPAS